MEILNFFDYLFLKKKRTTYSSRHLGNAESVALRIIIKLQNYFPLLIMLPFVLLALCHPQKFPFEVQPKFLKHVVMVIMILSILHHFNSTLTRCKWRKFRWASIPHHIHGFYQIFHCHLNQCTPKPKHTANQNEFSTEIILKQFTAQNALPITVRNIR